MANENSRDPTIPKPQSIPLAKIHDLPGIPLVRQPDKSYGGLVTSIQSGGVKEPVILRLREDGEYQLVTGYRRKRACELMKKQEIPALVYEMSLQEAIRYHGLANGKPTPPVPGKLVEPGSKDTRLKTSPFFAASSILTSQSPKEAVTSRIPPLRVPRPPSRGLKVLNTAENPCRMMSRTANRPLNVLPILSAVSSEMISLCVSTQTLIWTTSSRNSFTRSTMSATWTTWSSSGQTRKFCTKSDKPSPSILRPTWAWS